MWYIASADLEQRISSLSLRVVVVASIILVAATLLALIYSKRFKWLKLPLFLTFATVIIGSTLFLLGGTVYLNVKAESKGPVHWHSDIEFWACGSEIELRDPQGFLSNKIGSTTYHEHNDKRIHLEGVVVRKDTDASLEKFMQVTGGYINKSGIAIPLNKDETTWFASGEKTDGDMQLPPQVDSFRQFVKETDKGPVLELKNGQSCDDRSIGELQAFVYRYDKVDKTYTQEKLADPSKYVMRDESVVPPGDCVIVEFDAKKARTDKLCEQYGLRDNKRCESFGVKEQNPELCSITQVPTGGGE